MSDMTDPGPLSQVTFVSQIIVASLIMGVVIFLAIIILFLPGQGLMAPGGAFFAAIAFMLERSPIAAGMALVLLVVLAARFPTCDRIRAWLDHQLGLLQEERQFAL